MKLKNCICYRCGVQCDVQCMFILYVFCSEIERAFAECDKCKKYHMILANEKTSKIRNCFIKQRDKKLEQYATYVKHEQDSTNPITLQVRAALQQRNKKFKKHIEK